MDEQLLSVSTEQDGNRSTVVARGEIDETTTGLLVEAAKLQLEGGHDVILDMAGVSFMSSAGIAALVQLHTQAGTVGRSFEVAQPSAIVRRIIELVCLGDMLLQDP